MADRAGAGRVTVFCAEVKGVGRTTSLAGAAARLARSTETDVLIVQMAGRGGELEPGADVAALFDVEGPVDVAELALWSAPGGRATLRRVVVPAGSVPASLDGWRRRYGHILIDAPPVYDLRVLDDFLEWADTLAVCSILKPWETAFGLLREAAEAAERAAGNVAVVAVWTGIEPLGAHDLQAAIENTRRALRAARVSESDFRNGGTRVSRVLQIPFVPELGLRVGSSFLLLTGHYEELADALRPSGPSASVVHLVHGPRHRLWAEWIRDVLGYTDCPATLYDMDGYVRSHPGTAHRVVVLAPGRAPGLSFAGLPAASLLFLVDDPVVPAALAHLTTVDLIGLDPQDAVVRIKAALGASAVAEAPDTPPPPRPPDGGFLPDRDPYFTGRDELLEDLDQALAEGSVALTGPRGCGKSGVAAEYCHRYGGGYRGVWWVDAVETGSLLQGLVRFHQRLRAGDGDDGTPGPVAAPNRSNTGEHIVRRLSQGDDGTFDDVVRLLGAVCREMGGADEDGRRWLMVLDGLDCVPVPDGEERAHLVTRALRQGDGLVLVTTAEEPAPPLPRIALGALPTRDAAAFVRGGLPTLSEREAVQVAEVVDNMPLALSFAISYLREETLKEKLGVPQHQDSPKRAAGTAARSFVDGAAVRRFVRDFGVRKGDVSGREQPLLQTLLTLIWENLPNHPDLIPWLRGTGWTNPFQLLEFCVLLGGSGGVTTALLRAPEFQRVLVRDIREGTDVRESRSFRSGRPFSPLDSLNPLESLDLGAASREREDVLGEDQIFLSDPLVVDAVVWLFARYGLLKVETGQLKEADRSEGGHRRDDALPIRVHPAVRAKVMAEMKESRLNRLRELLGRAVGNPTPVVRAGQAPPAEVLARIWSLRMWEDKKSAWTRGWLLERIYELAHADDEVSARSALRLGGLLADEWKPKPGARPLPEYLRLLNHMAQAHRVLGDREDLSSALTAYHEQRRWFGRDTPRTLLSAGFYARALRLNGDLRRSRTISADVMRRLGELLGPDHPVTVQCEHNHALGELVSGYPQEALDIVLPRRAFLLATRRGDDPQTLRFTLMLAAIHREMGRHGASASLLKEMRYAVSSWPRSALPFLRQAESGIAITERREGRPEEALERDRELFDERVARRGADAFHKLSSSANITADLLELGRYEEALEQAEWTAEHLRFSTSHHVVQLPRLHRAAARRGIGETERARSEARLALEALVRALPPRNTWIAAARVCLANALAAGGSPESLDKARLLEGEALETYRVLYPAGHPHIVRIERNMALTRAALEGDDTGDHRERRELDIELIGI
ncbi:tetratricopeptide repeat protein [Actinocorallia sp. API 0066]|uniref:tetratricopeptide repeat protein n=1 Tax=Actinocorallia sp. API 0066 TaxID=2896846 RepID=UPI001E41FB69|nr:tetratricopeptide repeat protein [Actinocorallia sp. API 0066]MCD0453145.1 tetratricopeptide repeat protein [Actinocorallia sp. API 0066]